MGEWSRETLDTLPELIAEICRTERSRKEQSSLQPAVD
jgi:hypothetical protein